MYYLRYFSLITCLAIISTVFSQSKGYYDKVLFNRYKHEFNFGIGVSSCQTDVGGSKYSEQELSQKFGGKIFRTIYDTDITSSNFVLNAGYIYRFNEKIRYRGNLSFSRISGNDNKSQEFFRNNRNLNFRTDILELSAITEYHIVRANTGSKHNLRNPKGKRISPKILSRLGIYLVGGVGGFLYVPKAKNNFIYQRDITANTNFTDAGYEFYSDEATYHKLRPLHTEGQGYNGIESGDDFNIPGKKFKPGKTYKKVAVCIPFGFGIQKAFDSYMGIKIEFGIRYTFTDFLDDVSGIYYDKIKLAENNGILAANMTGTNSGLTYSNDLTYTQAGFRRGNPENNDYYGFLSISFYKTIIGNSNWFKSMNSKQKRKIRNSF
tara:strand:+ start:146 stop:1279 length:1134 start_codon:yes stop_codon:yes gene_type:complete